MKRENDSAAHPSLHHSPPDGPFEPASSDYPASLHAAIAGARTLSMQQEGMPVYVYRPSADGGYVISFLESTARKDCDRDGYLRIEASPNGMTDVMQKGGVK